MSSNSKVNAEMRIHDEAERELDDAELEATTGGGWYDIVGPALSVTRDASPVRLQG